MLGVTLSLCKNPVRLATPSPRTSLPRRLRTAQATHSRSSMARGGSRRGGDGGTAAAATPEEVQECLSKYASALPAAVVFDLDYTCWPFCECGLEAYSCTHA